MAAPNLTSGERLNVYRAIFLLNRSFHFIDQRLHDLENIGSFNPRKLEELRGLAQEVQLDINNRLIEELHTAERSDWHHFGTIRVAREKRFHR